jgi:hypothetical protein
MNGLWAQPSDVHALAMKSHLVNKKGTAEAAPLLKAMSS